MVAQHGGEQNPPNLLYCDSHAWGYLFSPEFGVRSPSNLRQRLQLIRVAVTSHPLLNTLTFIDRTFVSSNKKYYTDDAWPSSIAVAQQIGEASYPESDAAEIGGASHSLRAAFASNFPIDTLIFAP